MWLKSSWEPNMSGREERIENLKEEAREYLQKQQTRISYAKCCFMCKFFKRKRMEIGLCLLQDFPVDSHMRCKYFEKEVLEEKDE